MTDTSTSPAIDSYLVDRAIEALRAHGDGNRADAVRTLYDAYQAQGRRLSEQAAEWQRKWDNAEAVLHEAANDRNFCSEADDTFEEAGFNRRDREHSITVQVTLPVQVTVTGRNEEDAAENIGSEHVAEAVSQTDSYSLNHAFRYGTATWEVE